MSPADPDPLEIGGSGPVLRGEADGEGDPIVLAHGLTATRRYVLHGSRALVRAGHRLISYDARGHGTSDPAPSGDAYTYSDLASDLDRVIYEATEGDGVVLAGHSMGAHTIAARSLRSTDGLRALVIVGPVSTGERPGEDDLEGWDRLADGLEQGGVEGFIEAYDRGHDPEWRDTLLRIARDRLGAHDHPKAVADAIRAVSRDAPFDSLDALAGLDLPVLVVASHDDADPTHPYEVARAWAGALPNAKLVSEEKGDSPLAWQGGRLSREIGSFLEGI